MTSKKAIATDALVKALRLRKRLVISLDEPVSPIDSAERIGIEVRMVDLPSAEGMYVAGKNPTIILSSLRPSGRRNFTCAHEIGHHEFGHGDQFDELATDRRIRRQSDTKEYAADCFAAYFLMPKATIEIAMKRRAISCASINFVDVYRLASWLGVGYRTLINHLQFGLGLIGPERSAQLLGHEPRQIRQQLLGRKVLTNLHLVDTNWRGRAIDCEIGDYLLLPRGTVTEGSQLANTYDDADEVLAETKIPGIARISIPHTDWSAFVRVSRRNYVGRSCFRFEEEVNE